MGIRYIAAALVILTYSICTADPAEDQAKTQADPQQRNTSASSSNENSGANIDGESDQETQYVSFPAAGIKLIPPDGFDVATKFDGFMQAETQASVVVTLIPGPYLEVISGLTAEKMLSQGMTLREKQDITIENEAGMLLSVSQNAYGREFSKWIVVYGNDEAAKLVTATFPTTEEHGLSKPLKAVVLSVINDDSRLPEPGSDMSFSLVTSKKLKITRGINKILLYTKDGESPAAEPGAPLFIAAPSLSSVTVEDKQVYAVQRLYGMAHTEILSVRVQNKVEVDGLNGFELIAEAADEKTDTPLIVYHMILYDEGGYFLMQGLVGTQFSDEYVPEFQAMAKSFKRRQPPSQGNEDE